MLLCLQMYVIGVRRRYLQLIESERESERERERRATRERERGWEDEQVRRWDDGKMGR